MHHFASTAGVVRVSEGIRVDGRDSSITVTPGADALLGVRVELFANAGLARAFEGDRGNWRFALADIIVHDRWLGCLALVGGRQIYREGFQLRIDAYQAKSLRAYLPALARSAQVAHAFAKEEHRARSASLVSLYRFAGHAASYMVLDGFTATDALRRASDVVLAAGDSIADQHGRMSQRLAKIERRSRHDQQEKAPVDDAAQSATGESDRNE